MTKDEENIFNLISDKAELLKAIEVLLSNPEDKSEELLFHLNLRKQEIIKFIMDLLALRRSLFEQQIPTT